MLFKVGHLACLFGHQPVLDESTWILAARRSFGHPYYTMFYDAMGVLGGTVRRWRYSYGVVFDTRGGGMRIKVVDRKLSRFIGAMI